MIRIRDRGKYYRRIFGALACKIDQMQLSLVIPCYNECENLSLLVRRCEEVLEGKEVEVLLVDNGSTDESPEVLDRLTAGHAFIRTMRVDVNKGYGHGILTGLRASESPLLAWTHADMQTDPSDVLQGLSVFQDHANPDALFVKGRRYGRPMADTVFTIGMSIFETILLGRRLWDINAQPTIFSRQFFESWSNPPIDFSLDLYAYYHAALRDLDISRFPVRFGDRAHGVSHWNVDWRAKVKFIRRTMDYSVRLRRNLR